MALANQRYRYTLYIYNSVGHSLGRREELVGLLEFEGKQCISVWCWQAYVPFLSCTAQSPYCMSTRNDISQASLRAGGNLAFLD